MFNKKDDKSVEGISANIRRIKLAYLKKITYENV